MLFVTSYMEEVGFLFSLFTPAGEVACLGKTSVTSLPWQQSFLVSLFLGCFVLELLSAFVIVCVLKYVAHFFLVVLFCNKIEL